MNLQTFSVISVTRAVYTRIQLSQYMFVPQSDIYLGLIYKHEVILKNSSSYDSILFPKIERLFLI